MVVVGTILGIMCVIVRNPKILKVGAVSFHSRSLEFCGKMIGCHTKHFSMVWTFSNVFKRCLSAGVRLHSYTVHTPCETIPSNLNDFAIVYLVDN